MTLATAPAPQSTIAPRTLDAQDRCDRCGAQAYLYLVLPGKNGVTGPLEMFFCAHHSREHADAAVTKGFVIVTDDRAKLAPTNRQQGKSY